MSRHQYGHFNGDYDVGGSSYVYENPYDYDYPPIRPARRDKMGREIYYGREDYSETEEEERAPSDRADSEFTVRNEAVTRVPPPRWDEDRRDDDRRDVSRAASEIYAIAREPRTHSEMSHYTSRTAAPSDLVSVKTKTSRSGKLVMETMTAPHPCCPNTKGVCCLMILINLGLLLITLGFVIVLQLYEPAFVWYVGLSMLIFGFMVLFGSLIYCISVCRDVDRRRPPPGELYWTNQWTKSVQLPEIHYTNTQYKPSEYKGSEYSFKTEPSRTTANTGTSYR